MQKWFDLLGEMKKKDEVKKMEEEHQRKVCQIILKVRMEAQDFCTKSPSQQRGEEECRS